MSIKKDDNSMNISPDVKPWVFTDYFERYLKNWGFNSVFFKPVLMALFLVSAGAAVYFYSQYSAIKVNPQKIAQDERAALLTQVSRLIVLPSGEDPTLATVSNIDVLRSQAFFANARNGDRVLIYANAKKAILYDPDADKIVEVAPIVIGNPQPSTPQPSTKKVK